jgi:hypothetical protein
MADSAAAERTNPLRLNTLQLKTLAILQALARTEGAAEPPDEAGRVALRYLPDPHGDHFHVGRAIVMSRDATGLSNPAVYGALERKGLVAKGPAGGPALTPEGLGYPTGVERQIFHGGHH